MNKLINIYLKENIACMNLGLLRKYSGIGICIVFKYFLTSRKYSPMSLKLLVF